MESSSTSQAVFVHMSFHVFRKYNKDVLMVLLPFNTCPEPLPPPCLMPISFYFFKERNIPAVPYENRVHFQLKSRLMKH